MKPNEQRKPSREPSRELWRLDTPAGAAVAATGDIGAEELADAFLQVHLFRDHPNDRVSLYDVASGFALLNVGVGAAGAAELRRLTGDYLRAVAALAERVAEGGGG